MPKRTAYILCALMVLIVPLLACSEKGRAVRTITVSDSGFEKSASDKPDTGKGWTTWAWNGSAGVTEFRTDDRTSKTGSRSALIINNFPNDARYRQEIQVDGERLYRLSCWIKTENTGISAKGANLSVDGILGTSKDIRGTGGWEQVTLYGKTKKGQGSITLTLGLGGYGSLNTGKAWFDDVSVEEIKKLPSGSVAVDLFRDENVKPEINNDNNQDQARMSRYNVALLTYAGLYVLAVCLAFFRIKRNAIHAVPVRENIYLFCILASAFLFRIFTATIIEGWPNDIAANKLWAQSAARDLLNFYNSGWCDYPPLFIYVLAFVGKLVGIFRTSQAFTLLIKLPSIIADIATAYLLYRMAKKELMVDFALLLGGVYAFHPAVYLDSAIWGQVDSFFTMIIVIALKLLVEKRINLSAVFFAAAILMKPQGIFFLPLIFFELLKRRNAGDALKVALSWLATALVITLPFAIGQGPLWIFKLYVHTASEYSAAAMNAFNFFGLVGANLRNGSSTMFLLSYNAWGIIFDVLVVTFAGYLYLRSEHMVTPVMCAVILNAGAFIFSTKMHERYMFSIIALTIMALIYTKDRRIVTLLAGFSATVFFNIHILFNRMLLKGVMGAHMTGPGIYPVVVIFSLANILLFAYLITTAIDILRERRRSCPVAL